MLPPDTTPRTPASGSSHQNPRRQPWFQDQVMADDPIPAASGLEPSDVLAEEARKPKRTRKKPVLNCSECVKRKIRCDRNRPICFSCARHQTTCHYSEVANLLAASGFQQSSPRPRPSVQHQKSSPQKSEPSNVASSPATPRFDVRTLLHNGDDRSPHRTSRPRERPALFNVLGVGSQHPFHNYWTNSGGLAEVVRVLPTRDQADILLAHFFNTVHPLYPIVIPSQFIAEYERFWTLSPDEKQAYDPAQLALHLVIYAIGALFSQSSAPEERVNMADFYLSGSHQSLCIFSYLNRCSLATVQTMTLICYFLINKNRVSDAWMFSGITQRQIYALELNRDPDRIGLKLPHHEEQLRYRLWQAALFQDASLSFYLEMPPTTTHHDIGPSRLKRIEPMQTVSPGSSTFLQALLPQGISTENDEAYLKAMWEYALFIQQNICVPKCLNRAICVDPIHKGHLVSQFRDMYRAWDPPFNSLNPIRFDHPNTRLVRQLIALSSNYFYVLTMLYMEENESAGTRCDIYGALDAAHVALSAFFTLARLAPTQLDTWGSFLTRAHSNAVMISKVLIEQSAGAENPDARLMLAKSDFDRYLDFLTRSQGSEEHQCTVAERLAELQSLRQKIRVA